MTARFDVFSSALLQLAAAASIASDGFAGLSREARKDLLSKQRHVAGEITFGPARKLHQGREPSRKTKGRTGARARVEARKAWNAGRR